MGNDDFGWVVLYILLFLFLQVFIIKPDLVQLLEVATMSQLFQFDGKLYKQIDGVAMGSPLGKLMANAFLCSIEEKLN